MLDRFERTNYYIDLLKEQQFIDDKGLESYDQTVLDNERIKTNIIETNSEKQKLKSLILRLISIREDKENDCFWFLGITRDRSFYSGKLDRSLGSSEIGLNSVVECITDDVDELYGENYVQIQEEFGQKISLINDDKSIPTLSTIINTKIGHVMKSDCLLYFLEACILDKPIKAESEWSDDRIPASKALIGDDSSNEFNHILLEDSEDGTLYRLNVGDRIRILGALKRDDGLGDTWLSMWTYGSIEKIETGSTNSVNKIIIVRQRKTIGNIMVTLHKLEFAYSYTAAIIAIENMNNDGTDVHFYLDEFRAFQSKRQVSITSKGPFYKEMQTTIPPGIEEYGVVKFEPLEYTEEQTRFQFKIHKQKSTEYYNFLFDVNISR